jgi:hypothetical protein
MVRRQPFEPWQDGVRTRSSGAGCTALGHALAERRANTAEMQAKPRDAKTKLAGAWSVCIADA